MMLDGQELTDAVLDRFWAKVDRRGPDECWDWTAGKSGAGYGQIWAQRKFLRSHRVAFALATGTEPGRLYVCHKCDNMACCNAAHLYAGTQADNMREASERGRMRHRSERNTHAKLSWSDVETIRATYRRGLGGILARAYGVENSTILGIVNRRTWLPEKQPAFLEETAHRGFAA